MLYRFGVTVPANTAKSSPTEQTVRLTIGVIKKIEVTFPAGCAGLVGVRIKHFDHVVWPTSPDEWFVSDGYTIIIPANYELHEGGENLKIVAYNLGTVYSHTPVFRFAVEVPEEELAVRLLYEIWLTMRELAEKTDAQTDETQQILRAMAADMKRLLNTDLKVLWLTVTQIRDEVNKLKERIQRGGTLG